MIISLRYLLIFFVIFYFNISSSFPSSETFTNHVTIEVPSYLFIGSDQKDLNFSFSDYKEGAETNAQMVTYQVRGNHMMQAEGAPAVTAKLDGTFPNIDFKVQVGTFIKEGGDTELGPLSSAFISLGESETPIAAKKNSIGDGKLLRGQIVMTYKAVAKSRLTSGEYSHQLMVTLTDV